MKLSIAFVVLSGLAIAAVTLMIFKGEKNMSMLHENTEASIGLPLIDTRIPGGFETATFALG